MRAGLLSDPKVIQRLNEDFVCTSIIIDDLNERAEKGDAFAKRLAPEWHYPVEMVFLAPDGKVVAKLNSYDDFPTVHPDVSSPPEKQRPAVNGDESHSDRFLDLIDRHFEKK